MSENFNAAMKVALCASLIAALNSSVSVPAFAEPATAGGDVGVSSDGKFTPIGTDASTSTTPAVGADTTATAADSEDEKSVEQIAAEAKAGREAKREIGRAHV